MSTLVLFNKPYGVLSQFTDKEGRPTLANWINVPDVYVAGRLDFDYEGLLLLTDNGSLQHRISHPDYKFEKTYWVQVEGEISDDALSQLKRGVELKDGKTRPAKAERMMEPEKLWQREPPIRHRPSVPTSWVSLTISEGRNRQVRRMTAAVGFPTLRLIRYQIAGWTLDDLSPGQYQTLTVHVPASVNPSGKLNQTANKRNKGRSNGKAKRAKSPSGPIRTTRSKKPSAKAPKRR